MDKFGFNDDKLKGEIKFKKPKKKMSIATVDEFDYIGNSYRISNKHESNPELTKGLIFLNLIKYYPQ